MNLQHVIAVARGDAEADLLLVNGRMVNVFSQRIVDMEVEGSGGIAVADGVVVGMGDYKARTVVDLKGRYIAPGLIDAHLHIESAMVSVTEFARAVLPFGTTTVVADPHEIANVLGIPGIQYMLDAARRQPLNIYYTLPSCVPATRMETAGAELGPPQMERFMGDIRVPGLAEMMNYPGVIAGDGDVLTKLLLSKANRKPIDGHAPGLTGPRLNAYLCAGIDSDHECTTAEEALEKLDAGMKIMVREGTCARNLEAIFPAIGDGTWQRMMWCTDDRHPHDLLEEGHVDGIVRKAIRMGLDPVRAIRMGTLNVADYFAIRESGAIGPGRRADFIVFSDLRKFVIEETWSAGRKVAENGAMLPEIERPHLPPSPNVMHLTPDTVDFSIPAEGERIRAIEVIPEQVITGQSVVAAKVVDGKVVADPERDLLKIAVVERYTGGAKTGRGFVRGMGLRCGALASSVAHDSHNIIVVGATDADMLAALKAVVEMGGGFVAVADGMVKAMLPLPIAGLMSEAPVAEIRDRLDAVITAARKLGSELRDPFMALSFLALPVIPELKLTDKGLVDVNQFKVVPLFVD